MRAVIAGTTIIRRSGYKGLLRRILLHLVQNTGFSSYYKFLCGFILHSILQYLCSAAYIVSFPQYSFFTLRVGEDLSIWVTRLQLNDLFQAKDLMHHAGTVP